MTIYWKANFENGDFSEINVPGAGEVQADAGCSMEISQLNPFNGRYVAKATVNTNNGLNHAKAIRWGTIQDLSEAFYGAAFFVPSDFNTVYGGRANIFQVHENSDIGTQIFYAYIARQYDGAQKLGIISTKAGVDVGQHYADLPMLAGKWNTLVFHIKFIRQGLFEAWLNGTRVFSVSGDFRNTDPAHLGGFFDTGIYMGANTLNPLPQSIFFDEMIVASTLAEATPVYNPAPVFACPYGDATFNTQAELDAHILTHSLPPDPNNLANIPEDWGLEYGPPPTIIKVDPYFCRTPRRPSIRLDPHTAADVNTAREVNSNVHPVVKAGDHVIFKCWMATNPSTLEPPDPANPVSLYAGARIGIDFYGEDMSSGQNGYITGISAPTLPSTDEGVLQNYVHWGTPEWTQRIIEFDVPATAIAESNGQPYPVKFLLPWLQCWSSTYAGNDPTLAWFADAELTIIPSVPPPTIKYICPFDNQEFLTADEAITHLNTVHYPSPTLEKWVIEFKPWPIP